MHLAENSILVGKPITPRRIICPQQPLATEPSSKSNNVDSDKPTNAFRFDGYDHLPPGFDTLKNATKCKLYKKI